MKFSSLGSGSKGNALVICASDGTTTTRVLLDCGFSLREIHRRLIASGTHPSLLSAIIITHEHQDHVGSALLLANQYNIPIWMSFGTFQAIKRKEDVLINFCKDGDRLAIGDLEFTAFTVPHDAQEPLQFHVTNGNKKLGILTDLGQITPLISTSLDRCDALIIECNHDPQMLAKSPYPAFLKQRIRSNYGHLANEDAARFIEKMDKTKLKKIIGAHLSQQNNCPHLAKKTLETAVKSNDIEIIIACQNNGVDWVNLD